MLGVASTTTARAWERTLSTQRGGGEGLAIALTNSGDVAVTGALYQRRNGRAVGGIGVAKLRGSSGKVLWKRVFRGYAHDVTVDSHGNALVAAWGAFEHFTVMKLGGRDGALRWRDETGRSGYGARAVTVDAHGDVLAAGSLGVDTADWIVVKLSGAKGIERWRHVIPGGEAFAVRVDEVGDVIAAGRTTGAAGTTSLTVVKLAGADGTLLWRQSIVAGAADTSSGATALRLDAAGDVVVAGFTGSRSSPLQSDFAVAKLAGANGAELWRHVLSVPRAYAQATDVAVDSDGAVVVVGSLPQAGRTDTDFTALKLDPRDGGELWRVMMDGTLHGGDAALAVATDSVGDVAAAGYLQNATTGTDFVVVRLDGTDGRERSRRTIAEQGTGIAAAVGVDGQDHVVATGTKAGDAVDHFVVVTFPTGAAPAP